MKYHWKVLNVFENKTNNKNLELVIPDKVAITAKEAGAEDEKEGDFTPEIIDSLESDSLVTNMTKNQIKEHCDDLSRKTMSEGILLELAIGDCVISNFRETIQESSIEEKPIDVGNSQSSNNRQIQAVRKNAIRACEQSTAEREYDNQIEKQLLMGMCLSNAKIK